MAGFGIAARTVRVYLPAGHDTASQPCPLLLTHDGLDYLALGGMDIVLDNLIAARRIPPLVVLFVPAVDRAPEYSGAKMQRYGAWLADTVLPWAETRFRTRKDAASHATLGASDGGNIALHLGFAHPDAFGCVAAQSSNVVPSIAAAAKDGPKLTLRVYLDLGTYDIPVLLPRVRGLRQSLEAKGYEHRYREVHEGHSWGSWRARIDDALLFFFGSTTGVPDAARPSSGSVLLPNYPNPFRGGTVIPFTLASAGSAQLRITDAAGRAVASFDFPQAAAGAHRVHWDARNAAAGLYQYRLTAGTHTAARLMLAR
jgi:enterochelin esterase family protein